MEGLNSHFKFIHDAYYSMLMGSVTGKPDPSSIGGVLGDEFGVVKLVFSKSIGIVDSNISEKSVREAFNVFVSSNFERSVLYFYQV